MIIAKLPQLIKTLPTPLTFTFAKDKVPRRFWNRQKTRPLLLTQQDKQIMYNPLQALKLMRLHTFTSFEQSVQICVRLNVNPKNGDQIVRGTANLPAGLGKSIKTAVLCSNNQWSQLQELGAKVDVRIMEEDLKDVKLDKGPIQFEKLFTTPANLPKLKPYGKMLGPKGLMPNAKLGTLVPFNDLVNALEMAKAGQVSFRVDNGRNIHAQIGKMSFSDEQLLSNWQAIMKTLVEKRPPSIKGKYFSHAYLRSTMGPGWRILVSDIDPKNQRSVWQILNAVDKEEAISN